MRAVPYDTSEAVLLCVTDPRPRIKNYKTGEIDVDRETGVPLLTVDVAINFGGRAEVVAVMVPQPAVDESVKVGASVSATGLVYRHGISDKGRPWEMFTARALTAASEPEG
jgi:hypothetical protein